jgi:hypothetical protein
MTIDERLTTLEALWSAWAEHGQAMTDEQWQRPTRLGDWDVRSLYAHAGSWPFGFSMLIDRVRDAQPTHATAAALLRDFNAPDGVAHTTRDAVAAGAREDAAKYGTAQMLEQFASAGPAAIASARGLGPVVVDYFGRACCAWKRRSASESWKRPCTCSTSGTRWASRSRRRSRA